MGTPLSYLFVLWGLITAVLVVLLTYRSFLSRHEDDQIILSKSEASFVSEQQDIVSKLARLDKPILSLAIASGALLVVGLAIWIWTGLASL